MPATAPCRNCQHPVAPTAWRCPTCDGKRPYLTPWVASIVCVLVLASCAGLFGLLLKRDPRPRPDADRPEQAAPPFGTQSHPANPFANGQLHFDETKAADGEGLFREIMSRHPELDGSYREVDKRSVGRGFGAFISVPVHEWEELSDEQRQSLGHFMTRESPINGWSIYIGRIVRQDVMTDRTGLSSREWQHPAKKNE